MKQYPVQTMAVETGETLTYREAGNSGPTILLVHGNMSSSVHFQPLMARLEDQFQVYALDLPGFGDSTYNRQLESLHDFSLDVQSFISKLDLQEIIILGWSTGGGIVLEVAADMPERIKHVILLDSVGVKGYPMYKKGTDFQPILTERIYKRADIAADPVQVLPVLNAYETNDRDFMRYVWNASIYHLNQPVEADYEFYLDAIMKQKNLIDVDVALANFNITTESNGVVEGNGRIEKIQAPILILHGRQDLVVPISEAEEAKQWFGDQAELVVFEKSGHSVITDQLDELVTTLKEKIT